MISIDTNDMRQPRMTVTVTGFVERFVEIIPQNVSLIGAAGTPVTAQVKIISKVKFPFQIVKTRARHGQHIRFNLKETVESDNRIYLLTIENLKQEPGRYVDLVFLDTDSKTYPTIQIYVNGNITAPPQN